MIERFGNFNVCYRKGTVDENVIRDTFGMNAFLGHIWDSYIPKTDHVVIDVGAHIGIFTLQLSEMVKTVYSIEACEETFRFLCTNMFMNGVKNVSAHCLALSESNGECFLFHDSGSWGHSTVKSFTGAGEGVKCSTLKDFMYGNSIQKCDFIKFNCEGAEFPVILSSSAETLRKIDNFLVLYHNDLWTKNSYEDLLTHFKDCGFSTKTLNQTEARGWMFAKRE